MKRGIAVCAGILALAGLSGCEWWGGSTEAEQPNAVLTPVRGSARFKAVQAELSQGIAVMGEREVKMYWDENTVFVRDGQALREPKPPKEVDAFDFRGFEAHGEIALRVVEWK